MCLPVRHKPVIGQDGHCSTVIHINIIIIIVISCSHLMNLPVMCVLVFAEYVIRLMDWDWARETLPKIVSEKNVLTVYAIHRKPCKIAAYK